MLVHVPKLLDADQVRHCRAVLASAEWEDGRTTAGPQAAQVKKNLQLPPASLPARELGSLVLGALEKSPLFISAVLPQRVYPPSFNRYDASMAFGSHVDNAIRSIPGSSTPLRTDISATLFLSDPESYDGGELTIEDTYGQHGVKLPAGDLIVYPASSLHHVRPVTRGERLASYFWVQSLVRDAGARAILFDMDMALIQLNKDAQQQKPALVMLSSVYHNLLRRWASP
jgi:PKHD-type hydroxylase